MALRDAYKLDPAVAFDKGFRVEFYNDRGEVVGHVDTRYAGPSNRKFNAFRSAFMKPFERKIAMGSMPEAESDRLLQEAFIKGDIIAGWSEDLPLTVENFQAVMKDNPEMWRDIYTTAYNARFYALVSREGETGN